MKRIINEIKGTLKQEKQTFSDGGETDDVVKGWIEGLEYVLGLIENDKVETLGANNKNEGKVLDADRLSKKEMKNLITRLGQIEIERKIAWGLHRISGGFVRAELDDVDDDKINIVVTDGVQSDCENRVNITHCILRRDTLEFL